jgi:hypothetical protein
MALLAPYIMAWLVERKELHIFCAVWLIHECVCIELLAQWLAWRRDAFVCLLRRQPQPNKQTIEGISMKHNPKSLASFENQDAAAASQGRGEQFSDSPRRPTEWVSEGIGHLSLLLLSAIYFAACGATFTTPSYKTHENSRNRRGDAYLYIVGRPCATLEPSA